MNRPNNKKKKRSNHNRQKAIAAAAAVAVASKKNCRHEEDSTTKEKKEEECFHGCPTDLAVQQRDFYWRVLTEKGGNGQHRSLMMVMETLFWECPEVIAHPDTIPLGLALATNTLLKFSAEHEESNHQQWNQFWTMAQTYVRATMHLKKGSFIINRDRTIKNHCDPNGTPVVRSGMLKMHKRYQDYKSKRDIVLYLDRKIPCNCLAKLKQQILDEPELCQCEHCEKYVKEYQVCSRCEISVYCSKECQNAAWADHKLKCKFYIGELTYKQARAKEAKYAAKKAAAAESAAEASRETTMRGEEEEEVYEFYEPVD